MFRGFMRKLLIEGNGTVITPTRRNGLEGAGTVITPTTGKYPE